MANWQPSITFQERKQAMAKASKKLKGATADVRAQAALEIGRHLNAAQEELARCIEYIKQTPGASSLDDSFLRTEIEKHLEQMQSKAKATHQLLEKTESCLTPREASSSCSCLLHAALIPTLHRLPLGRALSNQRQLQHAMSFSGVQSVAETWSLMHQILRSTSVFPVALLRHLW
jgi:hypothetical protein